MAPRDDLTRDLLAWATRRPLDWTNAYERALWIVALRNAVHDLFAEPYTRLLDSRSPCYRDIARGMRGHKKTLDSLFLLAGMSYHWKPCHLPCPPWRGSTKPPFVPERDDTMAPGPDVFASWPPLRWDIQSHASRCDVERWLFRLETLIEYLASLSLRAYPDPASEERVRVEWTASRLQSHLARARHGVGGPWPDLPRKSRVPPLAFWRGYCVDCPPPPESTPRG